MQVVGPGVSRSATATSCCLYSRLAELRLLARVPGKRSSGCASEARCRSRKTEENTVNISSAFWMAGLATALSLSCLAAETPKRGGTLTYMIPADAPPTFDGHRETTYATIHSAAPYYSVLIRIYLDNPASTTDFVCDLCTEMPKPTDDGKTYTFKILQ